MDRYLLHSSQAGKVQSLVFAVHDELAVQQIRDTRQDICVEEIRALKIGYYLEIID